LGLTTRQLVDSEFHLGEVAASDVATKSVEAYATADGYLKNKPK